MKKILIQGLVAGVLAGIAGVIYLNVYQGAMAVDFGSLINIGSIMGASIIGCMLMALGSMALVKFNKQAWDGWLNITIAVLSFATIISPISMSLPLDIEFPELFPGLIVPMHFFPALAYFAIAPIFKTNKN